MANLTETETYDEGVYQLELTDPVIGGANGVSNAPGKNLANRTKYLKAHVDALEGGTTAAGKATKLATARTLRTNLASTAAASFDGSGDATPGVAGILPVANGGTGETTASAARTALGAAPVASPTFTGVPAAPTPAANTNTTQVATTAFVLGQAATATPGMNGTGAVGSGTRWAKEDHVHPSDTSRAPLASPTFTGTPAAPTPAAGTNTTQIATAAFVQAAITALVNSSPAAMDTLNELATALGNDPNFATTITNALSLKAPLVSPALTGVPTAPTAATGTNTTQLATTAFVQTEVLSGTPAGAVATFAMSTAPTGWLKANGASLLRASYPALFSAVGTAFGSVDSTHFTLPDLRGEFIRGWDDARGIDSGRVFGTAQTDAMQGHFHGPYPGDSTILMGKLGGFGNALGAGANEGQRASTGGPITDGVNGTPRTAAETRPRNIALLVCIKY